MTYKDHQPQLTPPRSNEASLEERIKSLEAQRAEDYAAIRELHEKIDTNHLAVIHQLGALSKLIKRSLKK